MRKRSAAVNASDLSIASGSLRPRAVHVVTSDLAIVLMRGPVRYLRNKGSLAVETRRFRGCL
jgi:hypothetical protein